MLQFCCQDYIFILRCFQTNISNTNFRDLSDTQHVKYEYVNTQSQTHLHTYTHVQFRIQIEKYIAVDKHLFTETFPSYLQPKAYRLKENYQLDKK